MQKRSSKLLAVLAVVLFAVILGGGCGVTDLVGDGDDYPDHWAGADEFNGVWKPLRDNPDNPDISIYNALLEDGPSFGASANVTIGGVFVGNLTFTTDDGKSFTYNSTDKSDYMHISFVNVVNGEFSEIWVQASFPDKDIYIPEDIDYNDAGIVYTK
jgi:hypothetical protein